MAGKQRQSEKENMAQNSGDPERQERSRDGTGVTTIWCIYII